MLISICIPQYNRIRYLLVGLDSIRAQDYSNIEVIISDDCSTDDSALVIPEYIRAHLEDSRARFTYIRQPRNLGYDGNLRAALAAAHGEYIFMLGNDDALARPDTLSRLVALVTELGFPDVVLTNLHLYEGESEMTKRVTATRIVGAGPKIAARSYRSFSFVSGVVIKQKALKQLDSLDYDGMDYIQMYLATRIIAEGGTFASIAESMVAKDVVVECKRATVYMDIVAKENQEILPKTGGLDCVGKVVCDAILPNVSPARHGEYILMIYSPLLAFTYSYWLYAYRKQGAFRASINLALGCFPPRLITVTGVSFFVHTCLFLLYLATTCAGLFSPICLLESVKHSVFRFSKRF